MRAREGYKRTGGTTRGPAASQKGTLPKWVFCGFVQAVHTNKSKTFPCDYVRFQIKPNGAHEDEDSFATVFSVTLPHDLGVQLEVGDAVIMEGTLNSWAKEDELYGKWWRLELVATGVREWDGLFKSEHRAQTTAAASQMLERRGAMVYPAGTAPKEPETDFKEASDEELAEFEAGIIGASAPVPF